MLKIDEVISDASDTLQYIDFPKDNKICGIFTTINELEVQNLLNKLIFEHKGEFTRNGINYIVESYDMSNSFGDNKANYYLLWFIGKEVL